MTDKLRRQRQQTAAWKAARRVGQRKVDALYVGEIDRFRLWCEARELAFKPSVVTALQRFVEQADWGTPR